MRLAVLTSIGLVGIWAQSWAATKLVDPQPAKSRIANVTVYQNSALVSREVMVPEGKGAMELIVSPLPPMTVGSSLHAEGTNGIRVQTTRYRTRAVREDQREAVRKIQGEIKKLQQASERLTAEKNALSENMKTLSKLEGFTAATMKQLTEKGALRAEETLEMARFVMESRRELAARVVELSQELTAHMERLEYLNRKMDETAAQGSKTLHDAIILIDKQSADAGTVRLNYLVNSASWRPQYKFRAGKPNERVGLEYMAAVTQQSGEDWSDVNVVLSTAQPMLNAAAPVLTELDISLTPLVSGEKNEAGMDANRLADIRLRSNQLRIEAQQLQNEVDKWAKGNLACNSAAALEQTSELFMTQDKVGNQGQWQMGTLFPTEGPSVSYTLRGSLTIPSRRDEQVIEVARMDLDPEYYYKAVPVLTKHVYLQADLVNQSEYVLLPGEATMYLGGNFVGRMPLPLVAIGEQFTAGFGVDPQLQVDRQLVEKDRSVQGGNQVLSYEYRILLSNYKSESVKVQLWDRLPHADTEAVGVTLVKSLPELSENALYQREERPKNLLRWDLTVDPQTTGEKSFPVKYHFRMEHDRQLKIASFAAKP